MTHILPHISEDVADSLEPKRCQPSARKKARPSSLIPKQASKRRYHRLDERMVLEQNQSRKHPVDSKSGTESAIKVTRYQNLLPLDQPSSPIRTSGNRLHRWVRQHRRIHNPLESNRQEFEGRRPVKDAQQKEKHKSIEAKSTFCFSTGRGGVLQTMKDLITTIKESYNAGVEAALSQPGDPIPRHRKGREQVHRRPVDYSHSYVRPGLTKVNLRANLEKPLPTPARGFTSSSKQHEQHILREENKADTSHSRVRRSTRPPVLVREKAKPVDKQEVTAAGPQTRHERCNVCRCKEGILRKEVSSEPLCGICFALAFEPVETPVPYSRYYRNEVRGKADLKTSPDSRSLALRSAEKKNAFPNKIPRKPISATKPTETAAHSGSNHKLDTNIGHYMENSRACYSQRAAINRMIQNAMDRQQSALLPIHHLQSSSYPQNHQENTQLHPSNPKSQYLAPLPPPSRRTTMASVWEDDIPEGGYADSEYNNEHLPDQDIPTVPAIPAIHLNNAVPSTRRDNTPQTWLAPLDSIGMPRPLAVKKKASSGGAGGRGYAENGEARCSPKLTVEKESEVPIMGFHAVPESQYEYLHREGESELRGVLC